MSAARERRNRAMLTVRDRLDRDYASPLDLRALALGVHYSPDHLVRCFRATFGETPHRYLQRRRIERAMFLLRNGDLSITEVCWEVGFTSLGSFSACFTRIVGHAPSDHRRLGPLPGAPGHFVRTWSRPSDHLSEVSISEKPDASTHG